jgi:hypothetical protein
MTHTPSPPSHHFYLYQHNQLTPPTTTNKPSPLSLQQIVYNVKYIEKYHKQSSQLLAAQPIES